MLVFGMGDNVVVLRRRRGGRVIAKNETSTTEDRLRNGSDRIRILLSGESSTAAAHGKVSVGPVIQPAAEDTVAPSKSIYLLQEICLNRFTI